MLPRGDMMKNNSLLARLTCSFAAALLLICCAGKAVAETIALNYDIVITNARVIDPETKLDQAGMNIGISGDTISIITKEPIKGSKAIDAHGLVAAPGFIDILSYDPNPYGSWYKIADGVTTNLAMHGGAVDPKSWYARYEKKKPPVNFGAGFFYNAARLKAGIGPYSAAKPKQVARFKAMAEKALNDGALGIGMSLEYAPGTSYDEVLAMMRVAKEYDVPVFFHARYSDMEPPGTNIEALNELISAAKATGASVHIDHINSTGGTFSMKQSLELLDAAEKDGLDISACAYPYPYWATYLNSARFDDGWQKRFRITYKDLQIGGTAMRLDSTSFDEYRKKGSLAVAYAIPEDEIILALASGRVMIGSDGIVTPGNNNHPRASGTYARTLGEYVRGKKALTLMDALAKMTIMPAKRLEKKSTAMRRKGRLQVGADADIVIFDPLTIIDTATVETPNSYSKGIDYVIVNGKIVKDRLRIDKKAKTGRGLRLDKQIPVTAVSAQVKP